MKNTKQKWTRTLAIAMVILQIPLFMLWDITYQAVRAAASRLVIINSSMQLKFEWALLGKVLLAYLPVILALTACLVLPIVGMISILSKKRMGVPTVCVYAVTVLAAGYLCLALFVGGYTGLTTQEYMFFRYFAEMNLPITDIFPLLQSLKYVFLGLLMAGSGVLCGLGIAGLKGKKKESSVSEPQNG